MAKDHGRFNDVGADAAVHPEMDLVKTLALIRHLTQRCWKRDWDTARGTYIAAAYSRPIDPDQYIVRRFELGNGAVFELHFVLGFEDEREVLSL